MEIPEFNEKSKQKWAQGAGKRLRPGDEIIRQKLPMQTVFSQLDESFSGLSKTRRSALRVYLHVERKFLTIKESSRQGEIIIGIYFLELLGQRVERRAPAASLQECPSELY